ncbi:MAG: PilZ domain-containing protein [Desulfobacteraceae bacterium]|nr:MAG: PilZ domain-containing protein [Desulfobacteraceae bacterium]
MEKTVRQRQLSMVLYNMSRKQIVAEINEILDEMSRERLLVLLKQLRKTPSKWKRKYPRQTCSISVDFDTHDYSKEKPIKNISANGAYIEAGEPFSIGQSIIIWLTIPGEKLSPLKISAVVARRDQGGVGVKFENLSEMQKKLLAGFENLKHD